MREPGLIASLGRWIYNVRGTLGIGRLLEGRMSESICYIRREERSFLLDRAPVLDGAGSLGFRCAIHVGRT